MQPACKRSAGLGRPQASECVKVRLGLHLYQQRTTSMDTFHGEGQGKPCAAADGTGTVTWRATGSYAVSPLT